MPTNIDTSEIPDFEVHDGYTKKFFSQNQTGNGRNNRRIRYLRHSFLWVRRYSKRNSSKFQQKGFALLLEGIRSEPRIFACCAQSVFCDVHAAAKYGFDFIRAGRGAHSARHGKAPPAVGRRGFPFMRGRSQRPSGRRLRRGRCRSGAGARRARR